MLLKAGFEESEVNDLMASLSEDLENKILTLDDLLDKLFDLSLEAEANIKIEQESFLEISAIKKCKKEYEGNKGIKWSFILSTNEAKIIGFNEREELIGFVDIEPGKIKVKKEKYTN